MLGLLGSLWVIPPVDCAAQSPERTNPSDVRSKLDSLEAQIETRSGELHETVEREQQERDRLLRLQEEIDLTTEVVNRLGKQTKRAKGNLRESRKREEEHTESFEQQRKSLAMILARYQREIRRLEHAGPERGRSRLWLAGAKKTIRAWADSTHQLADATSDAQRRRHKAQKQHDELSSLHRSKQAEGKRTKSALVKKERVVFGLSQKRDATQRELDKLLDQARLFTELMEQIKVAPPERTVRFGDFGRLRGHLIWPTAGTVTATVGEKVDRRRWTKTYQSGLFIQAEAGQAVVAVADGEVVFAGPRGQLGLVVVVNHGGGYFSIYARLRDMSVLRGALVRQNDLVGSTGDSHPDLGPGIDFQLRKGTEVLDPLEWLK